MTAPAPSIVSAWIALMRAQRSALSGVEADLKAADLPPLDWYDALLELRRAPDGLRASDLETKMLLRQYNLSRLLDRLERARLINRRVDPSDARARIVTLSPEGSALLDRMWPVYSRAIDQHLGARLTSAEAATLANLLGKIAAPRATETRSDPEE